MRSRNRTGIRTGIRTPLKCEGGEQVKKISYRNSDRIVFVLIGIGILLSLVPWFIIAYVVHHFVVKYW
jgi:hypothetical protein